MLMFSSLAYLAGAAIDKEFQETVIQVEQ